MNVLIIYDSFFGNTEQIARAVGSGLASAGEVRVSKVGEVGLESLAGVELLLVGSPTRGFRPTEGVKNFLKSIPANGLKGVRAAAFDTRIAKNDISSAILRFLVNFGGYAAPPIARQLEKKGALLASAPEGFFVKDSEGPLKEGELERAAGWAKHISGV